jgi:hypothetical protein
MRRAAFVLGVCTATLAVACENTPPAPYFLVAPSEIAPATSSSLTRWDSAAEWREWVDNPWTEGGFSLRSDEGIDVVHIDLRLNTSVRLYSPNFDPVFTGLRGVRVRVRYVPSATDPTALMHRVSAQVTPVTRAAPPSTSTRGYIATPAETPGVWQVIDVGPDSAPYYPPAVDARWMYLSLGRTGEVGADIDWIELLR